MCAHDGWTRDLRGGRVTARDSHGAEVSLPALHDDSWGPCTRCAALTVRYGLDGHPWCPHCRTRPTPDGPAEQRSVGPSSDNDPEPTERRVTR